MMLRDETPDFPVQAKRKILNFSITFLLLFSLCIKTGTPPILHHGVKQQNPVLWASGAGWGKDERRCLIMLHWASP